MLAVWLCDWVTVHAHRVTVARSHGHRVSVTVALHTVCDAACDAVCDCVTARL